MILNEQEEFRRIKKVQIRSVLSFLLKLFSLTTIIVTLLHYFRGNDLHSTLIRSLYPVVFVATIAGLKYAIQKGVPYAEKASVFLSSGVLMVSLVEAWIF